MLQKPEDFRSGVAKGSQWKNYDFTFGALTLEPSGFATSRK